MADQDDRHLGRRRTLQRGGEAYLVRRVEQWGVALLLLLLLLVDA